MVGDRLGVWIKSNKPPRPGGFFYSFWRERGFFTLCFFFGRGEGERPYGEKDFWGLEVGRGGGYDLTLLRAGGLVRGEVEGKRWGFLVFDFFFLSTF